MRLVRYVTFGLTLLHSSAGEQVWSSLKNITSNSPVYVHPFKLPPTKGGIAYLWNSLMLAAFQVCACACAVFVCVYMCDRESVCVVWVGEGGFVVRGVCVCVYCYAFLFCLGLLVSRMLHGSYASCSSEHSAFKCVSSVSCLGLCLCLCLCVPVCAWILVVFSGRL